MSRLQADHALPKFRQAPCSTVHRDVNNLYKRFAHIHAFASQKTKCLTNQCVIMVPSCGAALSLRRMQTLITLVPLAFAPQCSSAFGAGRCVVSAIAEGAELTMLRRVRLVVK